MNIDEALRCEQCAVPLTGQAVGGLCANCLLKLALDPPAELTAPADEPAEATGTPGEMAGSRIGNYTLLQQIGQGGFGTVWMAEQREPVQRRVALKIIRIGMDTREFIARFEQERQALAMMDHPNIAKVFDAGATSSGRPFFVMELVPGVPITKFCDEQKLPLAARLELFIEVCRAIQHAHQKGIIHRDIKPSNVMVTLDGDRAVPKVIDFGIAKATQGKLTDETIFTHFEQFIGTPVYMSPEQAAMVPDIDTRSDIYALGILLYELLTGKPPFDAKSLVSAGYEEMRRIICEVEPPKPSTRRKQERTAMHPAGSVHSAFRTSHSAIDQDLDWIVMKAIEKDRARRYETVNGLARDLERFLADEPVSATPPSASYKFRKFARRNKTALRVAAGIAAVLVAATIVSAWQAVRATNAEKLATDAGNLAKRRLVEVAAERDQKDQARKDAEDISTFLGEVFQSPDPGRDGREIKVAELLAKAAMKLETDLASQPGHRARLQIILGNTYHSLGLSREAIPLQEKARDFFRAAFGPEHSFTLVTMHNLANSYHAADRLDEAIKLREELLTLSRKLTDPEHPDTLAAMHHLAASFHDAGRLDEAMKLQEEVHTLSRKVNGPEHHVTLMAMNNLASAWSGAGRMDEALKMRDELLPLSRKVKGPEHPDTLMAMYNLANSYDATGRRDEALKMREDGVALCLKVLGPEHHETLMAMKTLAHSYSGASRHEEALKLHEEVLPLRRRRSGPDHTETLAAMSNLASSYATAGRGAEALTLREEVLPLSRKVKGLEHPETLNRMHDMALSCHDAGRREEALEMREELLALSRKVKGPEDPDTLSTMGNLATSYHAAGRREEALRMQEQALMLIRGVLVPEHPVSLAAMQNLAIFYYEAARRDEAIKLQEEVLSLIRKVNGPAHRDTLGAMNDLAAYYEAAGRGDEAIKVGEELLTLSRKVLGPDHRITLAAMHNVANSYHRAGYRAKAIDLREEHLKLSRKEKGPEHPDTLTAMHNMAESYGEGGRLAEAIELQEAVLMLRRKVLSPEHPGTLLAMTNLATSYGAAGRMAEAIELQEQSLAITRCVLPRNHPDLVNALRNMADLYRKDGRKDEAEALRKELGEANPSPPGVVPAPETEIQGEKKPGPRKPAVPGVLVAPDAQWKWLHPTDGKDPAETVPGFQTSFFLRDFDDSKWNTGQDSDASDGGFGYGLAFVGVNIGKPEAMADRRTAYFRHSFKTARAHANLELRCRRDDGIIVYLDGREVVRDNMEAGPDGYLLHAAAKQEGDDEKVIRRFPVGDLPAGTHVLAISVHNTALPSSDLKLGGVTLVEVQSSAKEK